MRGRICIVRDTLSTLLLWARLQLLRDCCVRCYTAALYVIRHLFIHPPTKPGMFSSCPLTTTDCEILLLCGDSFLFCNNKQEHKKKRRRQCRGPTNAQVKRLLRRPPGDQSTSPPTVNASHVASPKNNSSLRPTEMGAKPRGKKRRAREKGWAK